MRVTLMGQTDGRCERLRVQAAQPGRSARWGLSHRPYTGIGAGRIQQL